MIGPGANRCPALHNVNGFDTMIEPAAFSDLKVFLLVLSHSGYEG